MSPCLRVSVVSNYAHHGGAALSKAVEAPEPADLTRKRPPPWSEDTLDEVLLEIKGTILYFQGQFNYVQLCYGDPDREYPAGPALEVPFEVGGDRRGERHPPT